VILGNYSNFVIKHSLIVEVLDHYIEAKVSVNYLDNNAEFNEIPCVSRKLFPQLPVYHGRDR